MLKKIIISGSGGQGIQIASRIFSQACVEQDLNVSLIPSYGAEMRGGNTTCKITISENDISSPLFTFADYALFLTQQSYDTYKDFITDKGLIIYDSTINTSKTDNKTKQIKIFATEIVNKELKKPILINSIALGFFVKLTNLVNPESVILSIEKIFNLKNKDFIKSNIEAFKIGFEKA